MRKPVVIAYDISADATRRKIYKILLEWRLDGQKSVHECLLSSAEAKELFMQLGAAIDPNTDRLLLVWVTPGRSLHVRGAARMDRVFARVLNVR